MRTYISAFAVLLVVFLLFVRGTQADRYREDKTDRQVAVEYPADVKAIIDNKCYGCHSLESRSKEAKEKLFWDSIPSYNKAKQIARLDAIIKMLDEGEMPPKKFVEMKPEAAISAEDSRKLKDWATKTADALLN